MIREILPQYDPKRCDALDENGDVVCVDISEPDDSYLNEIPEADLYHEDGVGVSLAQRKMALTALAAIYAQEARANGLNKAVDLPAVRRELDSRYPDVDELAENTSKKATVDRVQSEAYYLEMLTRSRELIAAGFDPADIEIDVLAVRKQIRDSFGSTVGARNRNATLKRVYTPDK